VSAGVASAQAGVGGMTLPAPLVVLLDHMSPTAHAEVFRGLALRLHPPETPSARWRREIGSLAQMTRPYLPVLSEILGEADGPRTPAEVTWEVHGPDIPITAAYYDLHRPAGARPSNWLIAEYGAWHRAKEVAAGLLPDGRYIGRRAPVRNPSRGKPRKPRFERHEHPAAIRQCALALGRIPSCSTYILWSRVQRALARAISAQSEADLRLPEWSSFKKHYGGWSQALAVTRIDPDELAQARARLLPHLSTDGLIDSQPASAREVLATLAPADVADLGITPAQAKKMTAGNRGGFLSLPISTAAALAARLQGSLTWLAELGEEPGQPCDPDLRFSSPLLRDAWERACVPQSVVRSAAGCGVGEWRRILDGQAEPDLRAIKAVADQLAVRIEDLLEGAR
jgi:hypothetical protein